MSPLGILRTLTTLPAVFRRHKAAPLFREREAFLEHLRRNGLTHASLKSTASTLMRIPEMLRITTLRDVTHHEVESAAARWKKCSKRIGGGRPGPSSAPHFARVAKKWLRFHGKLLPRPPRFQPFSKELSGFGEYLRAERGYLTATATTYSNSTGRFLRWFSRRRRRFSSIRLTDIGRYFKYKNRTWSQVTLAGEARILRAFFRYAGERGLCSPHITYGIDGPPIRWNSFTAQPPPWQAVVRTIAATKGGNPAEIRARAILLLCATYGLRSGEIASLQLCNFDWENNTFAVNRSKRRGVQQFPISLKLRCALLRYLRKVRPNCDCGKLFVTFHAPFRAIIKESIYLIVRRRIDRIGVQCRHKGPHALRHACATRLLETGTSLRDIADFLGHRDCQSVRIYANHDLRALRSVSVLDLCGSL
jgi:integrase/recombinase XerD